MERRQQEIEGAEQRSEELVTSIEQARQALDERMGEEERARQSHDDKREAFERVSAEVHELEEALRELRNEIGTAKERLGANELALRESEMKLGHLDESVPREVERRTRPAGSCRPLEPVEVDGGRVRPRHPSWSPRLQSEEASVAPPVEGGGRVRARWRGRSGGAGAPDAAKEARANAELARLPLAERRSKLEEIRKKMQGLGEVNLGAIEEHEELGERMRFLSEQKDDLERTLASLRDAIARINRTSRKRFRETFEAVSKRFSENFPRLFRGGKASLTRSPSPRTCSTPASTSWRCLRASGCRTSTCSRVERRPSPPSRCSSRSSRCVPRPSSSSTRSTPPSTTPTSGRFNDIVSELATQSQFVLITHNKRTIEVSDVLYGVTMERKGISKLVAVEMH